MNRVALPSGETVPALGWRWLDVQMQLGRYVAELVRRHFRADAALAWICRASVHCALQPPMPGAEQVEPM